MKKLFLLLSLIPVLTFAADLKISDSAPLFSAKNQKGEKFELSSRKGMWTILYFYPKSGTSGCTKQACSFRDHIKKIQDLGADVFGISIDTVDAQSNFYKNQNLNFTLLADAKGEIAKLYGSKMPVLNMSKRWTFIIDPKLVIRYIDRDVDPVQDPEKVAAKIIELKAEKI